MSKDATNPQMWALMGVLLIGKQGPYYKYLIE